MSATIILKPKQWGKNKAALVVLESLFDYLRDRAEKSDRVYKFYFSGGDSNSHMTDFELDSINMEVCVMANDRKVALCLLRLVRYIVDNDNKLFWEDIEKYFPVAYGFSESCSASILASHLGQKEKQYLKSFLPTDKMQTVVHGYKSGPLTVNARIDELNIWTLKKIEHILYVKWG